MPRKRSKRSRRRPELLLSRDADCQCHNPQAKIPIDSEPLSDVPQHPSSPVAFAPTEGPSSCAQTSLMAHEHDNSVHEVFDDEIPNVQHNTELEDNIPAEEVEGEVNEERKLLHELGKHSDATDNNSNARNDVGGEDSSTSSTSSTSDSDSYLLAESDELDEFINTHAFELFDGTDEDVNSNQQIEEEEFQEEEDDDAQVNPSACTHSFDEEALRKASKFVSTVKRAMRRSVFLASISLYGKVRYTLDHYEHLVAMMQDSDQGLVLPCVSTMRRFVFPRLLKDLFVTSSIKSFPMKAGYSTYLPKSSNLSNRQNEAVVILPSTWAKAEIRSLHVLRELACIDNCRCYRSFGTKDLRVDSTAHVLKRKQHSQYSDTLWISKNGLPIPSTTGMIIKFHTAKRTVASEMSRAVSGLCSEDVRFRGELCTSFKARIVGTVHVRYSSQLGNYLDNGILPDSLDDTSQSKYNSCIRFLRSICRPDHNRTDENGEDQPAENNDGPQTRRQIHRQSDHRIDTDQIYLVPSDHITIVRFEGSNEMGVYVSRFWVQRLDEERNFFLFLTKGDQGSISSTTVSTIAAPIFVRTLETSAASSSAEQECKTTGIMEENTRYYMYRLILYADDFNARSPLFPKGSVGGLYMSPCSFNIRSRRNQTTIRTVSLTPAGVPTNAVLEFLIDDLVRGTVDGFECIDARGERVRIFFDIMGFIGDYPASSGVVDLKGHNATAPCTLCGFTFNKSPEMSVYAYATSIHSCNTAYRRTQGRTTSIRDSGLTKHEHKCLGLSVSDQSGYLNSVACPLLKLAAELNKRLNNFACSTPFQLFKKDGYTMNLIAPDHLITGLFKGVLCIVFIQLPNDDARDRLQISLKASLCEFGFQTQSVLFNSKKQKLVSGLSMSSLYCILTVLPSSLAALNLLDTLPCKRLLINLHRFFSLASWWPSLSHDGQDAWRYVHGSHIDKYHQSLQVLAANFVKSVNKFHDAFPSLSNHVDRPNVHRLLELAHHTIPLFNHLTYVCELVFESAHQPLKFFLSRNTTLNSHVYAVHLILAKDWMLRIWASWCIYRNDNETEKNKLYALMGLIRLFGGEKADEIDWKSPHLSSCLNEIREHIIELMVGTVEKRFSKWYSDTQLSFNSDSSWVLYSAPKKHMLRETHSLFFQLIIGDLSQLCLQNPINLSICHRASLKRGPGHIGKHSHERIDIGDIIQVLLEPRFRDNKFPSAFTSSKGLPFFFVVGGFIQSASGDSWAIVKKCTLVSTVKLGQLPDLSAPPLVQISTPMFFDEETQTQCHYLRMDDEVRKVGIVHNCDVDAPCNFDLHTRRVIHSTTTLNGGRFFLLIRSMAYPPRRS